MRKKYILVYILFAFVLNGQACHRPYKTNSPCEDYANSIIVKTKPEKLFLCGTNEIDGRYNIAIGKNGSGKKIRGDGKTPLGTYKIGTPRKSDKFHIFIPVEYPTPEQEEAGYTGGDIGIHGPWRPLRWLGRLTTLVNWTQGCIAVGTNREIEEIRTWVNRKRPLHVHITSQ